MLLARERKKNSNFQRNKTAFFFFYWIQKELQISVFTERDVNMCLSEETQPCSSEIFSWAGRNPGSALRLTCAASPTEKRNVYARCGDWEIPGQTRQTQAERWFELERITREMKIFHAFSKENKKETRNKNKSSQLSNSGTFFPPNLVMTWW